MPGQQSLLIIPVSPPKNRSLLANHPGSASCVPTSFSAHLDFHSRRWKQRHQHRKLQSFGTVIQYMQDTGSIITKRWLGCEAIRMPTGRLWDPISVSHGTSLLQFFPKALMTMRVDIHSHSMTTMWPGRTPTTIIHSTEGLDSLHVTVGSRHLQEKTKHCLKRRRWSQSQTRR